jgi:hypothetical protein
MSLTVLPFPSFHDWWTTIFSISSFKSGAVSSSMALYFWIKSIQRLAPSVSSFVSSSLAEMVFPYTMQRFSHNAFIMPNAGKVRAVDFRGIKKCASVPAGVPDRFHTVFLRRYLPIAVGKRHASHADLGYFNIP